MKYALFGWGSGLDLFFELEGDKQHEVIVVFDNNPQLPKAINGIPIDVIENIKNYNFNKIMITSRHYTDIYNQLILTGIDVKKIEVFLPLINF
jgi:hypothetical protein